jgi:hypothetical protein
MTTTKTKTDQAPVLETTPCGSNLEYSVLPDGRMALTFDPQTTAGTTKKGNPLVSTSHGFVRLPNGVRVSVNIIR